MFKVEKIRLVLWAIFILSVAILLIAHAEMLYVFLPIINLILYLIVINFDAGIRKRAINKMFFVGLLCLFISFVSLMPIYSRLFINTIVYYYALLILLKSDKTILPRLYIFFLVIAPQVLSFTMLVTFQKTEIDMFTPLGYAVFIAGLLSWPIKAQGRKRVIAGILGTLIIASISFVAYPNYVSWVDGSEKKVIDKRADIPLLSESGKLISVKKMPGKVVVLDFWYSGCGICFKRFPELGELAEKYKNDKNVFIAAVNIPIDRDKPGFAFEAVSRYRFNKFQSTANRKSGEWQIPWYPYIMVFDKNRALRYEGTMVIDPQVYINNLNVIISRLEKE